MIEYLRRKDMYMIESIKTRMPGGYFYERIRMLKTCSFLENPLLHNYLEYCKCAYWKGGKNCTKSALFNSGTDYVYLEDIKFPKLEGKDIGTFWCEFPDVFLPYMLEKWGGETTNLKQLMH